MRETIIAMIIQRPKNVQIASEKGHAQVAYIFIVVDKLQTAITTDVFNFCPTRAAAVFPVPCMHEYTMTEAKFPTHKIMGNAAISQDFEYMTQQRYICKAFQS
jgi:hypothetical protein